MLGGYHREEGNQLDKYLSYKNREKIQKSFRPNKLLLEDEIKNPTLKMPEKNLILNMGDYRASPEVYNPYIQTEDPNRTQQWVRPYYNLRQYQRSTNPIALGMSRTPVGNVGPIEYY